jgi:hypothetical protein
MRMLHAKKRNLCSFLIIITAVHLPLEAVARPWYKDLSLARYIPSGKRVKAFIATYPSLIGGTILIGSILAAAYFLQKKQRPDEVSKEQLIRNTIETIARLHPDDIQKIIDSFHKNHETDPYLFQGHFSKPPESTNDLVAGLIASYSKKSFNLSNKMVALLTPLLGNYTLHEETQQLIKSLINEVYSANAFINDLVEEIAQHNPQDISLIIGVLNEKYKYHMTKSKDNLINYLTTGIKGAIKLQTENELNAVLKNQQLSIMTRLSIAEFINQALDVTPQMQLKLPAQSQKTFHAALVDFLIALSPAHLHLLVQYLNNNVISRLDSPLQENNEAVAKYLVEIFENDLPQLKITIYNFKMHSSRLLGESIVAVNTFEEFLTQKVESTHVQP